MKRALGFGLLVSLVAGLAAQVSPQPDPTAAAVRETVRANTAFAADLYQVLLKNAPDENQFFSPYSISTILGLTAAGARGTTAAEMSKVLRASNLTTIHTGISKLTKDLQLPIANSIWASSEYPLLPSFTALAARYYETSGVYGIDFRSNPAAARAKINQWVEDQTTGRIKDLIPQPGITPNTAIVLANALYFKDAWQRTFDPRLTRDEAFHVSATADVTTSLMRAIGTWQYFEDDTVQVVSLPFKSGGVSMLLVVPRKVDGLAELEKRLTPEVLTRWVTGMERRSGQVFLPRFTLTQDNDLKRALESMGMVAAFSPQAADFRAMATPPAGNNIYISGVYHRAFLDLNEQGAEATAATAVALAGSGAPPTNTFILRADHPFHFVIRAEPSNEILFMGRLAQPTAVPVAAPARGRGTRGERGQRGNRGGQPAVTVVFKDPGSAAKAANELIAATRLDTAFVSPQIHPGLWDLFNQIERAANAVLTENPNNALQTTLANGLTQAISLTGQISNRNNESQVNRTKAAALQEKLREVANK
jgi:serpin B